MKKCQNQTLKKISLITEKTNKQTSDGGAIFLALSVATRMSCRINSRKEVMKYIMMKS